MPKNLSSKYQPWVDARKRFHLSHAHVQMARELGMNPKKLGGKTNHKQEPWKLPLPQFIEALYYKRFGKKCPDNVRSIEQMVQDKKRKKMSDRPPTEPTTKRTAAPEVKPGHVPSASRQPSPGFLIIVVSAILTAVYPSCAEQPDFSISAFSRNTITWQTQSGMYYNVEWAADLGDDTSWNAGWYGQTALLATSSAMSASIPAFFRIQETASPYLNSALLEETFRRQCDIEMNSSTNWWHAIETLDSFKNWYSTSVSTLTSQCSVIMVPQFGEVSYIMLGEPEKPLILISHGGLMGYDNAYILTNLMAGGYSILCPSRPGYPGTPLLPGTNDTFEWAADMLNALLDELSLTNRVFIFGTSAGGPTALQFAIRHQNRVRGVLLFDAVSLPYTADLAHDDNFLAPLLVPGQYQDAKSYKIVDATRRNPEAIMRSWFELVVLTNDATRAELAATYARDPGSVYRLQQFTRGITPISQRYAGTVNDIGLMQNLPDYPLNTITSPVFVSHSLYDGDVHIENAYNVISNVTGSVTSFFFHGGGHLFFLGDDWSNITHHAREFMDSTP